MTVTSLDTAAAAEPTFVMTRTFKASADRMWDAWTKPEDYARWFGPKGCTTTVISADIRSGGMLHSRMETADGHVMWACCLYREVTAPSRLVWVQSFSNAAAEIARAPFFDGRWPREMLTEVDFEADGDDTRVTLRWTPLNAEADEMANFVSNIPSMHGGWGASFDQLEQQLGKNGVRQA